MNRAAIPAAETDVPAGEIDLGRIIRAVRARWRWIAGPVAVAFVLSFLAVNLMTPRYTAEARLLLESRDSYFTRPTAEQRDGALIDSEAVASQVQVIMSRDLARDAIRKLNLVGNPEFDPLVNGVGPLRRFLMLIGVSRNTVEGPPEDRIFESFFDALLVYPAGKSRVVVIEFKSRDPDLAARAANMVAELYLERQEGAKKETARSASAWLSSTIEPLRQRVAEAERKVEDFRSNAGLFAAGNNTMLNTQQMADLSGQLATARAAQADSQAKAQLIRELIRSNRTIEIPDVANNELIRRLVEQRASLRSQLALELRTLLPEHPRIKELNAQLADVDRELRAAAERTVRTLEAEARIAGARVESLTVALDAQKRQVALSNESEVQLRALEREAKTQRDQLESYLAKYREATARDTENAMPADGRIVSRAIAPQQPSFPKKTPIIVLATIAAFVLSLGGVVAAELLAAPVVVAASATPRVEPSPVAAAIPAAPPRPVIAGPAEADIRARLAQVPVTGRGRRVLVVAPPDEGRLKAALDAVATGQRAVAIETHGAPVTDGEPDWGFTDLIAGDASFVEVIVRERGSRLHTIPLGTGPAADIAEDVESVEVALTALEQTYDLVLVAVTPDNARLLAPVFTGRVDNVLVARSCAAAVEPLGLDAGAAVRVDILDEPLLAA